MMSTFATQMSPHNVHAYQKRDIFYAVTVIFDLDLWTWPRYCQDEPTRQTSRFIHSRKGQFSHCHCDLWSMTVTFEHDLDSVKTNQHVKHLGQRSFSPYLRAYRWVAHNKRSTNRLPLHLFDGHFPNTPTRTHWTNCSTWTTNVISK